MKMRGIVVGACLVGLALAGCSERENKTANAPVTPAPTPAPSPAPGPNAPVQGPGGMQVDPQAMVTACLTPEEQRMSVSEMTLEKRREKVGCINNVAAQQIRPQLPVKVDSVTTLVDVSAADHVLTYHYQVDTSQKVGPAEIAQLEQNVRNNACTNPNMRQTIAMGGAYAYRWVDPSGGRLHAMTVDSCPGAAPAR